MFVSFLDKSHSNFLWSEASWLLECNDCLNIQQLSNTNCKKKKTIFKKKNQFFQRQIFSLVFTLSHDVMQSEAFKLGWLVACVCVFVKPPPYVRPGLSQYKRVTKLLSERQMTAALSGEQPCSLGYDAGGVCTQTLCRGSSVKKTSIQVKNHGDHLLVPHTPGLVGTHTSALSSDSRDSSWHTHSHRSLSSFCAERTVVEH